MVTFKEYRNLMAEDQKFIYYATGKTVESIKLMPQLESVIEKGYDVLCMTDEVDEFALRFIAEYEDKQFKSVSSGDLGFDNQIEESNQTLADAIKEHLCDRVEKVRISTRIKNHPVCFTTEGEISLEMEKVLNAMPSGAPGIKAKRVLEINSDGELVNKLNGILENNPDELKEYAEVLFGLAEMIEGITTDNPTALVNKICKLIS
jgi:molecular chaperone HtpG